MESFMGLPAHPLFVHFPVVLMPLVFVASVALAARPAWRRRFGWALALAAFAVMVGTFLAASSGEALNELTGELSPIEDHEKLANMTRILTVLFFLAVVATVVVDRLAARRAVGTAPAGGTASAAEAGQPRSMGQAGMAAAGLAVVFGLLGSIWMIRTGHEGASVHWDGTIVEEDGGG